MNHYIINYHILIKKNKHECFSVNNILNLSSRYLNKIMQLLKYYYKTFSVQIYT